MSRIWNVRLNTDALSRDLAGLEGDAEQAAYLRGLAAGAQGVPARPDATRAWATGHAMGAAANAEAVARQQQSAVAGRLSAAARGGRPPERAPNGRLNDRSGVTGNDGTNDRSNTTSNGRSSDRPNQSNESNESKNLKTTSSPPAEDDICAKPPAPLPPLPALPREPGLPDLQILGLIVTGADHERIDSLIRLYTGAACAQGVTTLMKTAEPFKGKRRVLVGQLNDWLREEFVLDADDYRRAGMAIPPDLQSPTGT